MKAAEGITLVTGATGHVGINLVRRLAARGERVRITVRPRSRREGLEGLALEEASAELGDPASLRAAAEGCARVYHLAAAVRLDPFAPAKVVRVNVEGTRNVLQAARDAGVHRFVHCSSVAAIGAGDAARPADETTPWELADHGPYFTSKRDAEIEVLRAAKEGFDAVVVNPGMIFGAWDVRPSAGALLLALARFMPPVAPPGATGFVGVTDVVDGLVRAMERGRPGERYVLVGDNLRWQDFLALVASVLGVRPPLLVAPGGVMRAAGLFGDFAGQSFPRAFGLVNTPMALGMTETCVYSSRKAKEELGWDPRPLREHLEEAYRWFRQHGRLQS